MKKLIKLIYLIFTAFLLLNCSNINKEKILNTDIEKSQELTKDEEKHLNTKLHTDLLNEDEKDKVVSAGKKVKAGVEAIASPNKGGRFNTFKEGLVGIYLNEYIKENQKAFNLLKDKNLSNNQKIQILSNLQEQFYAKHGYRGELPEIQLTDEAKSFAVDKEKSTDGKEKIFVSIQQLNDPNFSMATIFGHETGHLNTYDTGEETAKYSESKIETEDLSKQFTAKEKEEYIRSLGNRHLPNLSEKEQYEIAKNIPQEKRENFADPEEEQQFLKGVIYSLKDGKYEFSEESLKALKEKTVTDVYQEGLLKLELSIDAKYANRAEIKEKIEKAKKKAIEISKIDKEFDYFVVVDGKNETVELAKNPKRISYLSHFKEATIKGTGKTVKHTGKALYSLVTNNGEFLSNAIEGISSFGEVTTFGYGNYEAEKMSHIPAGEVQYGSLDKIAERKEKLHSETKSGIDMLTSFATTVGVSKIPNIPIEVEITGIPKINKLISPTGEVAAVVGETAGSISTTINASKVVGVGGVINAINGDSSGGSDVEKAETKNSSKKLEEARIKGKQGELDAGIDPNIKKETIRSLTKTAEYRIPDELLKDKKFMREIKNVKKQSYTNQIKDMNLWAQENGYTFQLEVRPNTKLTKPLLKEIEDGNIILKYIGDNK